MSRQVGRNSEGNIRRREVTFSWKRNQIKGRRKKREKIRKVVNRHLNFQGAFELTDPPNLQRLPHH